MNTNQIKEIKEKYIIEYINYCFENYDDIVYERGDYEGGAHIPDTFEEKIEYDFDGSKEEMIREHFIPDIVLSEQNYGEFYEYYDWEEEVIQEGFGKSSAIYMIGEYIEEKGIPFIVDLIDLWLMCWK